jgi:integrase/recombinase XerD
MGNVKPKTTKKLDPLMEGYLEYKETVERRSAGTVKDIRCTLRRVTEAMEKLRPGKVLWELKLTDFIEWLDRERRRGYSVAGLCKNASHLRGFLEYAWRSGKSDRNVMSRFYPEYHCVKREPASLTIEEALAMIQACPSSTPLERRDRMIVMLLYGCGLRTGELCALKIQDILIEQRQLHVKHAKGDIERMIPLPEVVYTELLAYLLERKVKQGPLFITEAKRRPIQQRHVGTVVREAAVRAGIARQVTPKMLRHSFATHLMDRGVDIAIISKLMGHNGPGESGVYLHILPGRTEKAVEKLD